MIVLQIPQGLIDNALESVSRDVSILIGLPSRADIGAEIINRDGVIEAVLRERGANTKGVPTDDMKEDSEERIGAMLSDHPLCRVFVTISGVADEDVSDEMVTAVGEAIVLEEEIKVRCLSLAFAVLQDPLQHGAVIDIAQTDAPRGVPSLRS